MLELIIVCYRMVVWLREGIERSRMDVRAIRVIG